MQKKSALPILLVLLATLPVAGLFAAGLFVSGCGQGQPQTFTLQVVMFQVEAELRRTQAALDDSNLEGVEEHVGKLRRWWTDPAHDRYIHSGKITKDVEGFLKVRGELTGAIDRLEEAARAKDLETVRKENGLLRSTCDRCHITYRPLVTKRYGS